MSSAGGLAVGQAQLVQAALHPLLRGLHPHLVDLFKRAGPLHGQVKILHLAAHQNAVAVDPAALDEIHIVVDHIAVHRVHQLPIPDVGKKVRLHDSKLHVFSPPAGRRPIAPPFVLPVSAKISGSQLHRCLLPGGQGVHPVAKPVPPLILPGILLL